MKGNEKMEKTIKIGEYDINMKATGNTPKRYREQFNKDMIVQIQNLYRHYDAKAGDFTEGADFEVVENLAYIMAKQANPDIEPVDEWFDKFEALDMFHALPLILGMWNDSAQTLSHAKKK